MCECYDQRVLGILRSICSGVVRLLWGPGPEGESEWRVEGVGVVVRVDESGGTGVIREENLCNKEEGRDLIEQRSETL